MAPQLVGKSSFEHLEGISSSSLCSNLKSVITSFRKLSHGAVPRSPDTHKSRKGRLAAITLQSHWFAITKKTSESLIIPETLPVANSSVVSALRVRIIPLQFSCGVSRENQRIRGPSHEHNTLSVSAVHVICHGQNIVILHHGDKPERVLGSGQCFSELELPFSWPSVGCFQRTPRLILLWAMRSQVQLPLCTESSATAYLLAFSSGWAGPVSTTSVCGGLPSSRSQWMNPDNTHSTSATQSVCLICLAV